MSLKNYFPASTYPDKAEFDSLLDTIYFRTDIFSYIAHIKSGRYHRTSPSFELLTGYTVKQFEEEGVNFYVKRVRQEDTLNVIKIQPEFFAKALEPGFDQSLPHISEMPGRLPRPDGSEIIVVGLGAPLAYLPSGEYDFALCIGYLRAEDDLQNAKVNATIRSLIIQAKVLYDRIYTSPKTAPHQPAGLVEIVSLKILNTYSLKRKKRC